MTLKKSSERFFEPRLFQLGFNKIRGELVRRTTYVEQNTFMALRTTSTSEFKYLSLEDTLRSLETSAEGLTESNATNRLKQFGFNEIIEKKKNTVLDFLHRYWGPMPWLLELAMGLSLALKHDFEGIIIFVLLTVNAIIGHIHARSSQKAVELLKKKLAIRGKVKRDGAWIVKEAREIVTGDIILVKLGDIIPADCKIMSGELSVDESALTGESMPVDAHPSQVIYDLGHQQGHKGDRVCGATDLELLLIPRHRAFALRHVPASVFK